ncbi:biotin--[acetyl-CoA-carboxylase] ligase [Halobacteriovorax marinus]|uniref:biotin--[acetyl-CoA-carboxylase] ligase n=1 Tax=Halobacteriovorax marinus TaxID=97084 RepID=UPI003A8CBB9D
MNEKIEHLHLEICESTQITLKEILASKDEVENILITSEKQTLGRGRGTNKWESTPNSIAMSFSLRPHPVITLTSLELGVLICRYFQSAQLKLKWPNDILNSKGLKSAGILCQTYKDHILVGLGLNYGTSDEIKPSKEYKFGRGYIYEDSLTKEKLIKTSKELYQFILDNRISINDFSKEWSSYCIHQNKSVTIIDDQRRDQGLFIGIGKNGEALLEKEGAIKSVYTGSLYLD